MHCLSSKARLWLWRTADILARAQCLPDGDRTSSPPVIRPSILPMALAKYMKDVEAQMVEEVSVQTQAECWITTGEKIILQA